MTAAVALTGGPAGVQVALADTPAAWWAATSGSRPAYLPPAVEEEGTLTPGSGQIVVTAQNRGDGSAGGETVPVSIADTLPAGLEAVAIEARAYEIAGPFKPVLTPSCVLTTLTCTFAGPVPPFAQIEARISVNVLPGASSGEQNTVTVSGGGAAPASASHPITVSEAPLPFGLEDYQLVPENVGGSIDTQAGSHPFQLTSVVTFNQGAPSGKGTAYKLRTPELAKDVVAELPAGMFGNPTPFVQCTDRQFGEQPDHQELETGASGFSNRCPPASQVGVAALTYDSKTAGLDFDVNAVPIFNMVPLHGEPARFGFKVAGIVPAFLDASVRTGGDYGVTVSSHDISQTAWLFSAKLTFWGVPGDPRHDPLRGWNCFDKLGPCTTVHQSSPPPFLTLPTSCAEPFHTTVRADSWSAFEHPAQQASPLSYELPEMLDGCNQLPFAPSISVSPDVPDASTSTGLTVGVHVSQTAALNPDGLAESTLKDTTVALPEGVAVNPSGGDGLQACSEGQMGFAGLEPGGLGRDLFSPGLPEPFCPNAAKVGTVKIATPLLPNPIEGAVYLASQNENPFGSLIAMYLVAQDPVSGTLVKLPGEVRLTETGQLVSTFKNTPELPFEDLELHFFGGERAPLATPARCGAYTTSASFAPWSGNPAANVSSTFQITAGPNGGPCPGASLPFAPSLTGGTINNNAGSFSPFTTTIGREDGNQSMQSVTLHMPPGLSGLLTGVKLCPEAQAVEGTCGPESLIGETTVSAGVGSDPVSVTGGRVYITEKYAGAPFGLSIVNPVKAGPFDLEHDTSKPGQQPACDCVVVRAKIEVDPVTAALTVTTDSSGAHAIPHLIDGVPVQIKKVNVLIDRPGFAFNPTNCDPMRITGAIASDEGASAPLSVPFQATNCATLAFKPSFSVSTAGRTSRANGASLHVKLTYPRAPFGSQANVAKVKVDLPKQLPSRLTTLQKACTTPQFEANPAGCPAGSVVGHAKAITPLIPVPLEGPAYFVSHGGAKFPELIIVLQGYGVTIDLHGETFISKAGITSSTFAEVPDAPVGSFELTLPEGKNSALAANGNLCKAKLKMPTTFTAQNGAVIHQSTPITASGCAKHRAKKASGRHKGNTHGKK